MKSDATTGFRNNYAQFQAFAGKGKQRKRSESIDSDCIIIEPVEKEKKEVGNKDSSSGAKAVAGYIVIDNDYDEVIVYRPTTPVASTSKSTITIDPKSSTSIQVDAVSQSAATSSTRIPTETPQTAITVSAGTSSFPISVKSTPLPAFPIAGQSFPHLEEARDAIVLAAISATGITYHGQAIGSNLFEFACSGKEDNKRCKARIRVSRLAVEGVDSWTVEGETILAIHNHPPHPQFIKNCNWKPKTTRYNPISDPRRFFPPANSLSISNRGKVGKVSEAELLLGRVLRNGRVIATAEESEEEEDEEADEEHEENEENELGEESDKERKEGDEQPAIQAAVSNLGIIIKNESRVKEETIKGDIEKEASNILPSSRPSTSAQRPRTSIKRSRSGSLSAPRNHRSHLPTPSNSSTLRSPATKREELEADNLFPEISHLVTPHTVISLPQLQAFLFHINPLLSNIAEKLHRNGLDNSQTLSNLIAASGNDLSFDLFFDTLVKDEGLKGIVSIALKSTFVKLRSERSLGFFDDLVV